MLCVCLPQRQSLSVLHVSFTRNTSFIFLNQTCFSWIVFHFDLELKFKVFSFSGSIKSKWGKQNRDDDDKLVCLWDKKTSWRVTLASSSSTHKHTVCGWPLPRDPPNPSHRPSLFCCCGPTKSHTDTHDGCCAASNATSLHHLSLHPHRWVILTLRQPRLKLSWVQVTCSEHLFFEIVKFRLLLHICGESVLKVDKEVKRDTDDEQEVMKMRWDQSDLQWKQPQRMSARMRRCRKPSEIISQSSGSDGIRCSWPDILQLLEGGKLLSEVRGGTAEETGDCCSNLHVYALTAALQCLCSWILCNLSTVNTINVFPVDSESEWSCSGLKS